MNNERFEILMVKVVDDVATPAEREELMTHLKDNPALQAEYESHVGIAATSKALVDRLQHDLVHDQHQAGRVSRFEQGFGMSLVLIGTGLLLGFGLVEFLIDDAVPTWLRFGGGLCGAGAAVLLFSAIRWRFKVRPHDPYKEVIR